MTPCREWQGPVSAGYGAKTHRGPEAYKAGWVHMHRWVVAQIDGWDAIKGKIVMHTCDNRRCFRYDHLRIGTPADNSADMVAKGRQPFADRTHCPQGHPYNRSYTLTKGPRAGQTRRSCSICTNAAILAKYHALTPEQKRERNVKNYARRLARRADL